MIVHRLNNPFAVLETSDEGHNIRPTRRAGIYLHERIVHLLETYFQGLQEESSPRSRASRAASVRFFASSFAKIELT